MTHPQPRNPAPEPSDDGLTGRLPRRLPALGLPAGRERRRAGAVVSILIHVVIIAALIIGPALALHTDPNLVARDQGAGGKGPAGGGGGGTLGIGGYVPEKLTFVHVAPAPAPTPQPAATIPPVTPPPVVQPKPEVTPPKSEAPQAQAPAPQVQPTAPPTPATTAGTGGGSGADGTAGNGPGTGGGVGAGNGTGRGSGTGPGTGGGTQENNPPQPTAMFLPPLPAPKKLQGFQLIAQFDVDADGKVLKWSFTPTPDGGYNRELENMLKSVRFRPGTKPDGTPIRMIAQITYAF